MTHEEIIKYCLETEFTGLMDDFTPIAQRMAAELSARDEKVNQALKPDLIGRRELLMAFYAYIDDKWALGMLTDKVDEVIEGFEKNRLQRFSQLHEMLIHFLIHLNDKGLINNYDFDYEKEAKKYSKKLINCA